MTVSLGGLDTVVFTGGVWERAPYVHARTVGLLTHLGMGVDEQRNADARPDVDISRTDADVRTLVVAAREDLQIATGVEQALAR